MIVGSAATGGGVCPPLPLPLPLPPPLPGVGVTGSGVSCPPPLFPLSLGVVGCTGCSDEEEPVFSVALLSVLGVVVSVVCCVLDSVAELELAGACASVVEEEATGASAFT